MTCELLGEGREVLHSCDKWDALVDWFHRYLEDGTGGWKWFELKRDGRVVAKYAMVPDEMLEEDEE